MSRVWSEYAGDLFWVGAGIAALILYHVYIWLCVRRSPECSIQSLNAEARLAWVRHVMSDPGQGVLAIQTLRNSTMAATFFASTAVLLSMGVLTLSSQSPNLAESWHLLSRAASHHPELWMIKLLALLLDLFAAFFSFAIAVRLFNHVGYQINLPPALRPASLTPEQVARHLNRAGGWYSVGMRAFFFAVPLVFWLFGPELMAAACVLLVPVLYHLDRVPAPQPAPPTTED